MTQRTAVVIGGSMAGILAARILADHFDHVTIVERDELPDAPDLRNGVPQGRHLHALLAQGQELLEHYFPGLSDELTESGAPRMTWCRDTCYYTAGGWLKRFDSGIVTNVITRPDLEWRVRRRLAANGKVHFLTGCEMRGLTASADKRTITGVEYERRSDHTLETLSADLVVDASGRGSKAPDWLTALGYDAPPETAVNAYIGYATRIYEKPADFADTWRVLFIVGRPAQGITRGAGVFDIGHGKWMVTLGGMNKDYPPTDEAGFLEYARAMASSTAYDVLKHAKPLSPVYGYRITGSRLRHFEKLARRPENFVALGDAVCAFNPLYGQGITTAALGAQALDTLLAQWRAQYPDGRLTGLAERFQQRLSVVIGDAWLIATGEDLRYPGTEGDRPGALARMTQRYIDLYLKVSCSDETLTRAFIRVTNLTAPPTSLFAPHLVARVVMLALRGRFNPTPASNERDDMIPAIS